MAIRVKTIQNISNQSIDILCQAGDTDNAAGDIPYARTGMLKIPSGGEITIEAIRVDDGQLKTLAKKDLLKITDGLV